MDKGSKGPTFSFNESASARSPIPERGLTFVIRTDAAFATGELQQNIARHIRASSTHPLHQKPNIETYIKKAVHEAYRQWGHDVLAAKAECLDYSRYGLSEPEDKNLHVHFYNAHALTSRVIALAEELIRKDPAYDPSLPLMFISLDDMIQKQREPWADIGFSRLFSKDGRNQFGFTGRPGMRPLSEQIMETRSRLEALFRKHSKKIPVVLLEDNVRHAKMLNWVIDLLDRHGFSRYADIVGISTCFCCASDKERSAVRWQGKPVPIAVAVDYKDNPVDVITPRDLMLDGFVIELEGNSARLPGIFMDVVERFKIHPGKAGEFKRRVLDANIRFCQAIEEACELTLPVAWWMDAVCHVHGVSPQTPTLKVLQNLRDNIPDDPANDDQPEQSRPGSAHAPKAP